MADFLDGLSEVPNSPASRGSWEFESEAQESTEDRDRNLRFLEKLGPCSSDLKYFPSTPFIGE